MADETIKREVLPRMEGGEKKGSLTIIDRETHTERRKGEKKKKESFAGEAGEEQRSIAGQGGGFVQSRGFNSNFGKRKE